MQTYLALLRGINVSGQKLIKMERLREVLSTAGYKNVKTYIQSGNIIFDGPEDVDHGQEISNLIKVHFGFDVGVVIKNKATLLNAVAENPYDPDSGKVYVVFLSGMPEAENISKWENTLTGQDESVIINDVMYVRYFESAGSSKLTNALIENRLKVMSTMRNWNTTIKLLDMLD